MSSSSVAKLKADEISLVKSKPPPLPSIGGGGDKPTKTKTTIKKPNDEETTKVSRRRKSLTTTTTTQGNNDSHATVDQSSTVTTSTKNSNKKSVAHEWNRYFAYINDKEREKLMQLPDIMAKPKTGKKSTKKRGENHSVELRSKSAKIENPNGEEKSSKRTRARSAEDLNRNTTNKTSDSKKNESRRRKRMPPNDDEAAASDKKKTTSTPKDDNASDSSERDRRRDRQLIKKLPPVSSLLGNFNFNSDLDNTVTADRKRNKLAGVDSRRGHAFGYDYYRSEANHRVQCRPQLIDEYDELTLADEFRTLKFRTAQNNLIRSMRSNMASFSKVRDMHHKFLEINHDYFV